MENYFMEEALKEAFKAYKKKEVPVGAVIVRNGKIIARAHNLREKKQNSLYHAEVLCINKACKKLHSWRLDDCDIYVTLEPCAMCSGAIIQAKIQNIYYGTKDPKGGFCGSKFNVFELKFNYIPNVVGGILEDDCSNILKDFFKELRSK